MVVVSLGMASVGMGGRVESEGERWVLVFEWVGSSVERGDVGMVRR